jgi:hypothetical protein
MRLSSTKPGRRRDRLGLRVYHFGAIGFITSLLTPALLHGQRISILEPEAWRDLRSAPVELGQPLRVAGTATHPNGIARVVVNGVEATLTPVGPTASRFVRVMPADSLAEQIVITLFPRTGDPFEQRYSLTLPTPVPPPTTAVRNPANVQTPTPQVATNPWRGFTFRSIGYGAVAAGGLVLSGDNEGVGYALVGVAVTAFVIDLVVTSRKAKRGSTPQDDDASGLSLSVSPLVLPRQTVRPGVQLQLQFR